MLRYYSRVYGYPSAMPYYPRNVTQYEMKEYSRHSNTLGGLFFLKKKKTLLVWRSSFSSINDSPTAQSIIHENSLEISILQGE